MQLVSRCDLADELAEVQEWAHGFAVDVIRPSAARNDQERLQPLDVLKSAFEIGLLTLAIPAEYGGGGASSAKTRSMRPQANWRRIRSRSASMRDRLV